MSIHRTPAPVVPPPPGAEQTPFEQTPPPGHATPAHGSTQAPSRQNSPDGQETAAQAASVQRPSLPHDRPAAHPRQPQFDTQTP